MERAVIFLMVMMELSQLRLAIEVGEDDDGDEEVWMMRKVSRLGQSVLQPADLQWNFSP